MAIDAKTVKQLREKTGAGMMDCKRALTETEGDMDAAVALLRERGLAGAAKKSGRVAAEGLVDIYADDDAAVIVELNCETDFVAKNPQFQELLDAVGNALLASGLKGGDGQAAADIPAGTSTVGALITESITTIGENVSLRRFQRVQAQDGLCGAYKHAGGKIAVVVELSGATPGQAELAKSLAMQVAAASPRYVERDEVPASELDSESEIYRNQALASGKPEKILDRIVAGKLEKFFAETCLIEQEYVRDSDLTIAKLLQSAGKEGGVELSIARFVRYQLGEGIEKKEANLAQEVAEQIAQGS